MAYDPDRFAFWHRWLQACIYDYHRVFTPQGTLRRSVRLGPIPREAVMEYGLALLSSHATHASLRKAVRRAIGHVSKHRPRADAIIITPEEVYILKVKRHPTQADVHRLEEYAALFPTSPEHRAHAHKPIRLVFILASLGQGSAHQLDDHLPRQAEAAGIQLLPADRNAHLYPP